MCCICGVAIEPNNCNMCVNCLSSRVDITQSITKEAIIHYCKGCERYLRSPSWMKCELESQELLSLCLKKIRGLNRVKLIDAGFIWTEPHSKRIKIRLTIQKEVMNNTILQHTFVVEFSVHGEQCPACKKSFTPHTWTASVQVRQKALHKGVILYLEQIILKHRAHEKAVSIKEMPDGIDFFFKSKSDASMLVDFITGIVMSRSKSSKRLISHSEQNNEYNYKFTFSLTLPPVNRYDLIYLPKKVATALGGISHLQLCVKVGSMIELQDIVTLKICLLDSITFFKHNLKAILSRNDLSEYIILNIEKIQVQKKDIQFNKVSGKKKRRGKAVAHISEDNRNKVCLEVQRKSDFGKNSSTSFANSSNGHLFKQYDKILCYDMQNFNRHMGEDDEEISKITDVVVVKKLYTRKRNKKRIWKLKKLHEEVQMEVPSQSQKAKNTQKAQEEEFLQEIEENKELRSQINLYKDEEAIREMTRKMEELQMEDVEGTEISKADKKKSVKVEEEVEVEEKKEDIKKKRDRMEDLEEKGIEIEEMKKEILGKEKKRKGKKALRKEKKKRIEENKMEECEDEEDIPEINIEELLEDLKIAETNKDLEEEEEDGHQDKDKDTEKEKEKEQLPHTLDTQVTQQSSLIQSDQS